jgi:hypothetical protein
VVPNQNNELVANNMIVTSLHRNQVMRLLGCQPVTATVAFIHRTIDVRSQTQVPLMKDRQADKPHTILVRKTLFGERLRLRRRRSNLSNTADASPLVVTSRVPTWPNLCEGVVVSSWKSMFLFFLNCELAYALNVTHSCRVAVPRMSKIRRNRNPFVLKRVPQEPVC